MTLLEERVGEDGRVFLHASVTMPSLEVAAIGGGSNLEPQKSIVRDMTAGAGEKPGDKGIFYNCYKTTAISRKH